MDLALKGKCVVISGGLRGIGAGISLSLLKEGATVAIISRSLDKSMQKRLLDFGKQHKIYIYDLKNYEGIQALVDRIHRDFKEIYALVNNAGENDNLHIEDTPISQLIDSYAKNLFHYYELTRCLLASIKRNEGSILNIVSKVAFTGQGKTSAYASAKAAQIGFTREWACAFAKDNVRVNAIAPAEVMTPLYEKWLSSFANPKQQYEKIASKIPLGKRFTTVEEIGDFAAFLLSPKSSHTTGQIFCIDGGYVALDRVLT